MDIYFTPQWGKLGELIEGGEAQTFTCETDYGCIRNQFILRKIPWQIDGKQYYDIVTPYGYGGANIEYCADGRREDLVCVYENQFQKFCEENAIVSEFVRFHPLMKNGEEFRKIYNSECIRSTVATDLSQEDVAQAEFTKSCRKNIRKGRKAGLSCRITENPSNFKSFISIYKMTMDRNQAGSFYYFSEDYFDRLTNLLGEKIILAETMYQDCVVAAGILLLSGERMYFHLSGNDTEYLHLYPSYVMYDEVAKWGKEHGFRLLFHGGGRSNDPEDSLYLFKKQFGRNIDFDFYVGRKVWDREIYDALCGIKKQRNAVDVGYFPAYRDLPKGQNIISVMKSNGFTMKGKITDKLFRA